MEKLLYPLWAPAAVDADAFRDALLQGPLPQIAGAEAVHGLRLAVADSDVAPASGRRLTTSENVPDALLTVWLDCASAAAAFEPLLAAATARFTCYLVAEAEPLVADREHPAAPGQRRFGMVQVVFMNRVPGQSREDWLGIWKDSHTRVAIDTQSSFGYRQNVVVRCLGEGTAPVDAIVEEHFPPEAMASDHAFYATGGDEALLQQRMQAMMESCARFIDFGSIDVLPMSEYSL